MPEEFIYHDGSEKILHDLFSRPEFDENNTWSEYNDNWPVYYHLSPERKNLVRWLNLNEDPLKILELGAGCGAITSYFSSLKNKPQVVAVEGSKTRAELIKLRCKEADNLSVHTKNIQDYEDSEKYDIVTLIGVLEYSGVYVNSPTPFLDILKKAVSFLKPDGVLLIAIENQFGHKYFAGFNEDHYGVPFEGISDYPHYNGMRTFDRQTLRSMMCDAGLAEQSWFYPFPDYKMPKVVFNERSFSTQSFDWLALMNMPTTDFNSKNKILFDEKTFLSKMHDNVDVSVFMNSFLICASKSKIERFVSDNTLSSYMQFSFNKKFQSIKEFVLEDDEKIFVHNNKFVDNVHLSTDRSDYHVDTNNLLLLVVDAWFGQQYEKLEEYLNLWLDTLRMNVAEYDKKIVAEEFEGFCHKHFGKNLYQGEQEWISGKNLDLILRNCLVGFVVE